MQGTRDEQQQTDECRSEQLLINTCGPVMNENMELGGCSLRLGENELKNNIQTSVC